MLRFLKAISIVVWGLPVLLIMWIVLMIASIAALGGDERLMDWLMGGNDDVY